MGRKIKIPWRMIQGISAPERGRPCWIVVPTVAVGGRFSSLVQSCETDGGIYCRKQAGQAWGFAFFDFESALGWARRELGENEDRTGGRPPGTVSP